MNLSRLLGIHLLIGSFITCLWTFICPKMTISDGMRLTTKLHMPGGGTHSGISYYMLDPTAFAAGVIIIWGVTFGIYFLRKGSQV